MNSFNLLRGFRDIAKDEGVRFKKIIKSATDIANLNNFEYIQLPILEFSNLFERNLGEESDILSKEIYKFSDRNGETLALRPEMTAGNMRYIINNGLYYGPFPKKYFSYGPNFRYDRPQKGRYRQFYQLNYEVYGNLSVDALCLQMKMIFDLLLQLETSKESFIFKINHLGSDKCRQKYTTALVEYLSKNEDRLSQISKERLVKNPLRILDSKEECDIELLQNAPKLSAFWESEEFEKMKRIEENLKKLKINYAIDNQLVRGLDYYTGFVFEVFSKDLNSAIGGGGEYNKMLEQMLGKKNIQMDSFGFALGVDRLALIMQDGIENEMRFAIFANDCFEFLNMRDKILLEFKHSEIAIEYLDNTKIAQHKRKEKAKQINCTHIAFYNNNNEIEIKTINNE
ncbi:MAG: histidine--tRNA ligase [Pseudomonadota bacterium]|jgi:histidyl-tRNA synthetase